MASDVVSRLRRRRALASLVLLAAAAWIAVVVIAQSMGNMPGTMGLGVVAFVGGVDADDGGDDAAERHARSRRSTVARFTEHRTRRIMLFGVGLPAGVGGSPVVPAFALAWRRPTGSLPTIAPEPVDRSRQSIFAACGVYQLTPLKDRCLAHAGRRSASSLH